MSIEQEARAVPAHSNVVDVGDVLPEGIRQEVLEQLVAAGAAVEVPDRWLVHERAKHGGRAHGFISLKPLDLGTRRVQAGDILAAEDETPALERMLAHGDIAELPLDRGVLALVLAFRSRVEQLEAQQGSRA